MNNWHKTHYFTLILDCEKTTKWNWVSDQTRYFLELGPPWGGRESPSQWHLWPTFSSLPSEPQLLCLPWGFKERIHYKVSKNPIPYLPFSLTGLINLTCAIFLIDSRSYCVFAAVGILAVYLLQSTLFVAWFAIDLRRVESRRNGIVFCFKHAPQEPQSWSPGLAANTFSGFSKII